MTLDEAIKHCHEKAKKLLKEADKAEGIYIKNGSLKTTKEYISDCEKCSEEHAQLAGWLTELQERREADKWRPISEPPKEHDYYLVTCEFGVASATDIALFYPDRKGKAQWSLNYVTAWKPLPEPYESEAENG